MEKGMPNMSPSDMNMNYTTMKDMSVMHMSFYWGRETTILFQGWPDYNLGMYILSLLFVFFLALAVEVLSNIPSKRFMNIGGPVIGGLVQAIIYTIRMALAYMVMLSVMSFNLGIFIVAVAGHGIGYFLVKFRQLSQQSQATTENNNNVLPK